MKIFAYITETNANEFNLVVSWNDGTCLFSDYYTTMDAAEQRALDMGIAPHHIIFC